MVCKDGVNRQHTSISSKIKLVKNNQFLPHKLNFIQLI